MWQIIHGRFLSTLQNLYDSAATGKDSATHSANDPMTPITEEAAPEFPSSFIGSAGDIAQGDNALTSTKEKPVNSNEALLEKCNAARDNSLPNSAENDKGSLQEEDVGCADLRVRDNLLLEEQGTADTTSTVALQVDKTTLKREGVESDTHSAIHQKDEIKFEDGSAEKLKICFGLWKELRQMSRKIAMSVVRKGAVIRNQKLKQTKAFQKMMLVRREVSTCTPSRAHATALQRFTSLLPLIATGW